ncbi:hypothetical protein GCM10025864_37720 [Luteimicrobium album]|uniref:Luciferase-like domain-containing protein n=1 Tax=Luteimicrobium album TaxID=1054550 RepID=A0ABQ6I796_9MICO|nr:hypothetical protein GCM10025864_37720 [Luteimicrobium album]
MRLGAHLMRFDSVPAPALRQELLDTADAAEEAGLGWLSVMDHWFQMVRAGFPASDPMLEAYTTLGFLAARTETVQLGALVTGVTYRYPGLLAKTVATLDVLAGGRGTLGIGAAWYGEEHAALGVPFPPLKERFERLEETVQIARQMFDPENDGPFDGAHYQLGETLCSPQPLSKPEIMIGGPGRRRRCASSRSTRTPATSSARPRTSCSTSSTCCTATARTSAATPPRSGSPRSTAARSCSPVTSTGSSRRCAGSPTSASTP